MSRMHDLYNKQAIKELMTAYNYKNINEVPKITKVVINAGVGRAVANSKFLEDAESTLKRITGQAPIVTKAKKSISSFKLR